MVDSVRRRLAVTLLPLLLVLACTASPGSALPPPITVVTGQSAGWPDVRGFDRSGGQALQIAPWGTNPLAFSAYSTYQYGVRVAVGDVNGDGTSEIVTAPGKGAWTELRVFDGTSFRQIGAVLPFTNAVWWNGAFVATGDTTGDGRAEIVGRFERQSPRLRAVPVHDPDFGVQPEILGGVGYVANQSRERDPRSLPLLHRTDPGICSASCRQGGEPRQADRNHRNKCNTHPYRARPGGRNFHQVSP